MIKRVYDPLTPYLAPGKVLLLYGPRRSGKTTILRTYLAATRLRFRSLTGDNIRAREVIGSQDLQRILDYAEGYSGLAIDEAQNIPNIGIGLKLLVDHRPDITVIATGSSSFELAGQVGEPLTGRKRTLILYPVAQYELLDSFNKQELHARLGEWLVLGSYPEVITAKTRAAKIEALSEISDSYLLKDILSFERVRQSSSLLNLLKLLSFQVGNLVSLNELATQLGIDVKTVQRYLDLLQNAFVIYRLGGFSRNLRNEITAKAKYYFLDNGIRNAVISQFNDLDNRNDIGAMWENFAVIERLKTCAYTPIHTSSYFWRTHDGQEIDLVEERDGGLFGFEFKWHDPRPRTPARWAAAYPGSVVQVITPENFWGWVKGGPGHVIARTPAMPGP